MEYQHLFALTLSKLGKTSLVQNDIKLDDVTPFKEGYCRIPPHQYEEVKKHLQEMLGIGAIQWSTSPWASPVVLVFKKDGSLWFWIDLRKLNNWTTKDAQSLPRIEDSLDCLDGTTIFTGLDLQSGYWQVELTEASRTLTAFRVGLLGFYGCDWMPFGLTNVLATFQCLMESCLGGNASQMMYNLFRWHHCFLENARRAHQEIKRCVWEIVCCWIETQTK